MISSKELGITIPQGGQIVKHEFTAMNRTGKCLVRGDHDNLNAALTIAETSQYHDPKLEVLIYETLSIVYKIKPDPSTGSLQEGESMTATWTCPQCGKAYWTVFPMKFCPSPGCQYQVPRPEPTRARSVASTRTRQTAPEPTEPAWKQILDKISQPLTLPPKQVFEQGDIRVTSTCCSCGEGVYRLVAQNQVEAAQDYADAFCEDCDVSDGWLLDKE